MKPGILIEETTLPNNFSIYCIQYVNPCPCFSITPHIFLVVKSGQDVMSTYGRKGWGH